MKILYIVPNVTTESGVARVLSIKANYWIERYGYQVAVITQNYGHSSFFYSFNNKIEFYDITLNGNLISFFSKYIGQLNKKVKEIDPDIIVVSDNGLKAYTIPFFLKTNARLIFESHSSRFLELKATNFWLFSRIKFWFRKFGASHFDHVVCLTDYSALEWNSNNSIVIPNPNVNFATKPHDLKSKKVIAVGRHVYEKGFDMMLPIWKKVLEKYPKWQLDIYGKSDENKTFHKLAKELGIDKNVTFFEPIKNLENQYHQYSFLIMTSRFEGFGLVLMEALSVGLPCLAFDCPVGPRGIIQNNYNGFLIQENKLDIFTNQIFKLIENKSLCLEMSQNAKLSVEKFDVGKVMKQWNELFLKK